MEVGSMDPSREVALLRSKLDEVAKERDESVAALRTLYADIDAYRLELFRLLRGEGEMGAGPLAATARKIAKDDLNYLTQKMQKKIATALRLASQFGRLTQNERFLAHSEAKPP